MKSKYSKDNRSIKQRMIDMFNYIVNECKDVKTLIVFIIVVAIIYSPVWLGYILYYITKSYIALTVATACLAFWAGPFTPFFPSCVAITLFIKNRFYNRKDKIKEKIKKTNQVIKNNKNKNLESK